MKRRRHLALVLGLSVAMVVAWTAHFLILRQVLRPDDPEAARRLLRFDVHRAVADLDALLAAPAAPGELARALGAPVAPAGAAPPPAGPGQVTVRGAHGTYTLAPAADRAVRVRAVPDRGPALDVGPVPVGGPLDAGRLSLALAVAFGVALLFSVLLTAPLAWGLDRLRGAAVRLAAGDLGARARIGHGPVREVGASFDAMADHTQQLLETQREMLLAVSHELRTPTARIRFALEMLDGAPDPDERARRLAGIDEDLAEVDELVGEILAYARIAGRRAEPEREPVDVAAELADLARYATERRAAVALDVLLPEGGVPALRAERRLFRRAVRNLVLNACRYARERVRLRVRVDAGAVRVEVCDDGPGVPPEQRARVFEPFARADESRSRDAGGVGLGLAIVQRIMTLHGGAVAVDTCPDLGGARFVTTWPREASG